jgi:superfamily II DNA/RNA helicase
MFIALGAPPAIAQRLAARGITEPFPIQTATIADAMAGRDVCGRAPTGSGKTIAFGIPLIANITKARPRHPRGLVLVPTRELAAQVAEELVHLAGPHGPSVACIYGGVGFGPQTNALRRGVDILVACPGRLTDLIQRRELELDAVEIVVIDEADRMADMGFLPSVRKLLDAVRPNRQTLLFSATLDGDVDVLVRRYQRNPVRRELATKDDADLSRHVFWKTSSADRVQVLTDVVNAQWPAIVFCRTKHGADRLAKQLGTRGVAAAAIHGDRSQGQRDRALAAFAGGRVQVLVATDVAARGIHVDDVAAGVHYDPPGSEKDYIHRSGRTGRAGRTGLVVSLINEDQRRDAAAMQRKLGFEPKLHHPDVATLREDGAKPRPVARAPQPQAPTKPAGAATGSRRPVREAPRPRRDKRRGSAASSRRRP